MTALVKRARQLGPAWFCAAVVCCVTLPGVRAGDQTEGEEGRRIVARIVADWKARSRSIDSVVVEAKGTAFYEKGMFDDDVPKEFAGSFPERDTGLDVDMAFYVDFAKGRLRDESTYPLPDSTKNPPRFIIGWREEIFTDGRQCYRRTVTTGRKDHWFAIISKHEMLVWLGVDYCPVAWSTGNIPRGGVASTDPRQLRTRITENDVEYLGTASFKGRTVHRLAIGRKPSSYSEFWVDVERGSLVMRGIFVRLRNRREEVAAMTLEYAKQGDTWQLTGWSAYSVPGDPRIRFRVKKYLVNSELNESLFRIPNRAGTEVIDATGDKPKRYIIGKDGKLVPKDTAAKLNESAPKREPSSSKNASITGLNIVMIRVTTWVVGIGSILVFLLRRFACNSGGRNWLTGTNEASLQMSSRALVVACSIVSLAVPRVCAGDSLAAQAFSTVPMTSSHVVVYRQGHFGFRTFAILPWSRAMSGRGTREVELVFNSDIQHELGFDEDFASKAEDFKRWHATLFEKLRRKAATAQAEMIAKEQSTSLLKPAVRRTYREICESFARYRENVHQEIREVIPKESMERFYQLEMRRRITHSGIVTALITDDGFLRTLPLDEAELEKLSDEVPKLRAAMLTRTMPLYSDLTDEIGDVLDASQRRRLEKQLIEAGPIAIPVIEHLMWQCRFAQQQHLEVDGLVREAASISAFDCTASGQLKKGFPRGSFFLQTTDAIWDDASVAVSSDQTDRYSDEYARHTGPLYDRRIQLTKNWRGGRVDYPKFVEETRRLNIELEQASLDILRVVLSPRQMERATELIQQRLLIQRGLLPSLNDGSLGRSLKLTDAQRRRIREIAAKFLPKFRKLSIELEAYVWKEIKAALSPEQRSRLSRLVGPSPKKMPGSPNLILMSPSEYRSLEIREPKRLRETIEIRYRRLGITPASEAGEE